MATPVALSRPPLDGPCSCGSGQVFGACCAPILARERAPSNAEQLMRARFSAHVTHDYLFLHQTYLPTSKLPYTEEESSTIRWTKLVVHSHEVSPNPDLSSVEFTAYFVADDGTEESIQEKSEFKRIEGAWYYTRLLRQGPAPFKATTPKVGRNDPCPCGSGKKYKHCCLRAA